MERRSRRARQRQNRIVGAVVIVAAVLLVVVVALALSGNRAVDESIFESSDNRLVISMDAETASFEDGEYEPEVTRIVYYHNGKDVTKMEIYFEYETEDVAKEANDNIILAQKEWATSKSLKGRFIVFDVASGQYKGLTVEQIKETIDNMRAAGTLLEKEEIEATE